MPADGAQAYLVKHATGGAVICDTVIHTCGNEVTSDCCCCCCKLRCCRVNQDFPSCCCCGTIISRLCHRRHADREKAFDFWTRDPSHDTLSIGLCDGGAALQDIPERGGAAKIQASPSLLTNCRCKRTSAANRPAAVTRKNFCARLHALFTPGDLNPSIDLSYTRNSARSYSMTRYHWCARARVVQRCVAQVNVHQNFELEKSLKQNAFPGVQTLCLLLNCFWSSKGER